MIVDSSAIVASIFRERTAERIGDIIDGVAHARIGSPTLVEAAAVLIHREGDKGSSLLAAFLQRRRFDIVSFGDAHWRVAQVAYLRYGKGRGHPARLNFGDCLTYATAKIAAEPLLCVGDDFPQTDLELVDLG
jgi:ribonuclease VapC